MYIFLLLYHMPSTSYLLSFIFYYIISYQCMDAFGKQKLMNLSQVEQTMSTGVDEEGKEIKGGKLTALILDTLKSKITVSQKLRILCIYIASQRNATTEDKRQLIQVHSFSFSFLPCFYFICCLFSSI